MENKTERSIHRVGTMTSGIALIVFGILFLLHMIVPTVNFLFIFRLWPIILIMLGIEILIGNFKKSSVQKLYIAYLFHLELNTVFL